MFATIYLSLNTIQRCALLPLAESDTGVSVIHSPAISVAFYIIVSNSYLWLQYALCVALQVFRQPHTFILASQVIK
jgi:hypothetical protein